MSRILAAGMIVLFGLGACSSSDSTAEETSAADTAAEETAQAGSGNAEEGEYADLDALLGAAEENGYTCDGAEETTFGEARAAVKCEDGTIIGSFWNPGFKAIAVRESEAADDTPVLHGKTWAIVGEPSNDLQEGLGGEIANKSEF